MVKFLAVQTHGERLTAEEQMVRLAEAEAHQTASMDRCFQTTCLLVKEVHRYHREQNLGKEVQEEVEGRNLVQTAEAEIEYRGSVQEQ